MKKILIVLLLALLILSGCDKKKENNKELQKEKSEVKTITCKRITGVPDYVVYLTDTYKFRNKELIDAKSEYVIYDTVKGNAEEDKDLYDPKDYKRYIYGFDEKYIAYVNGEPDASIDIKTNQINEYGYELRIIIKTNLDVRRMANKWTYDNTKEVYKRMFYAKCEEK